MGSFILTLDDANGIVEFDGDRRAASIKENSEHPRSNHALTGLYFFDRHVYDYSREADQ